MQQLFSGFDAYKKIAGVLRERGVQRPLIVCDAGFDMLFIKPYILKNLPDAPMFSDFTPNPVFEDIRKGIEVFESRRCDFILSIGGGSCMDVAKCINILTGELRDEPVMLEKPRAPHMAVPTTAGTGSEATRFAVMYLEGEKYSVDHSLLRPDMAVLEPAFLRTLPEYQKKATMLDALCQGIESIWSVRATDESRDYAQQAVRLVLDHMDAYMRGDDQAFPAMMAAAHYSGKAINISQTTAAHALSYKLSSLYVVAHGHAVAICLPYVWRKINRVQAGERLGADLKVISGLFDADSSDSALSAFEGLLEKLRMDRLSGGDAGDIPLLCRSVNAGRLGNFPIPLSDEDIWDIYAQIIENRA
ncbi:MAG: phosphonoacetaldehyde reductase [Christensenellales bacterium]|jgi:alcohol dehydrogenase class IV